MHEKQVAGFERAIKKTANKSKLRLMDITEAFGYRVDGHPGPYRSPDPNKITKRGPDGRPPPQDCLHCQHSCASGIERSSESQVKGVIVGSFHWKHLPF
ncbi:hypothetical protein F0562_031338 [Nyssa sinensis]|uniref:Trichome birefringence-like C-terminal domain-containing protein n=1 Tax=Nyssa sinensis TaxID=561372 RepID=A0A5J5AXW8_9ASTE|nr:hypothetical protein F0562_031338 [Nyssa sinensis]